MEWPRQAGITDRREEAHAVGKRSSRLPGARSSKSPTQEPLLTALARAFHWQDLVDAGKYASISDLARALGLDRSYVSRIMRLALLAPEIVEAIVEGREPSGLSLERLVKGMPVVWAEQRERLGFGNAKD